MYYKLNHALSNQKPILNLVETYLSTFLFKIYLQIKTLFTISTSVKNYQIFKNFQKLFTSHIHCHGNYKHTTLLRNV